MRSIRALFAGALAVLLLSASGGSTTAADPWFRDYDYALRALDRADWTTAVKLLESSIRKQPHSSQAARTYGMRFVEYFPYYFLGIAQYHMERREDALQSFEREAKEKAIERSHRHAEQLRLMIDAAKGPPMSLEFATANARRRVREIDSLVSRAKADVAAGRPSAAVSSLARVLALDSTNADARALLPQARSAALTSALQQLPEALRPSARVDTAVRRRSALIARYTLNDTLTTAARLESSARELLRMGFELLSRGSLDSALVKSEIAVVLVEQLPNATELRTSVEQLRSVLAAAIRRAAETRRQLEIASAAPAAPAATALAPKIAINTPSSTTEPLIAEEVMLQGVVMDFASPITAIEVELNGKPLGGAQLGNAGASRGVVIDNGLKTRIRTERKDSLGTVVNFFQNVPLPDAKNVVTVRATNGAGQTSTTQLEVLREIRKTKTFAVIIGVGKYENPKVRQLDFTVPDADSMYRYVIDQMGADSQNVIRLTDAAATMPKMRSALLTKLRQARPEDLVLIYFAGHGAPEFFPQSVDNDSLEKYLLSVEADPADLPGTAFPMNEIAGVFDRIAAERVIFIADACYSGAAGGRTIPRPVQTAVGDNFLKRLAGTRGRGRVILTAAGPNETSEERRELGHGVFTYYLLEGLAGAADYNHNGLVTVDEIEVYVAYKVPNATGGRQHPVRKGEVEGALVLGRSRAASPGP